jgi:hypothetical protein
MRDFHMTEKQALKYPLNRAFALVAFHGLYHPLAAQQLAADGYIAQERSRRSAS